MSMDRRIIIVHPSEIFRKGMEAVLSGMFNTELILLSTVDELKDYNKIRKSVVILMAENGMFNGNEAIGELADANITKKIAICDPGSAEGKDEDADLQIETTIPAQKIYAIIHDMLDVLPNGSARAHESSDLTDREKDVLKLVAHGHSNKEIADKLFISIHTVISHRQNITEKLGIKSISGLTVYAIINGLIDTEHIDPRSLI